jgi:hypothetical protein
MGIVFQTTLSTLRLCFKENITSFNTDRKIDKKSLQIMKYSCLQTSEIMWKYKNSNFVGIIELFIETHCEGNVFKFHF